MKVLLVGSGAREHALARGLTKSPSLSELHAAPGNPGIAEIGTCHPVRVDDIEGLVDLAQSLRIDLVVVGPEAPLVAGLADQLRKAGIATFGPSAAAAEIEGSKAFAKDVLDAAGVPTARILDVPKAPCVVKADGLASGKGVFICNTEDELAEGLAGARALGDTVVVEEMLTGPEVSVFALCDGSVAVPLASARDFKRIGDGDTGPNTGGMGAYSPVADSGDLATLVAEIHQPVLDELARRGTPFIGCLFAGLMLTPDGPRVLEFNARFGDPETQVIVARLEGDLLAALAAAAAGDLSGVSIGTGADAAVTIVVAGPDYPARSDYTGAAITGIDDAESDGAFVFHGGTAMHDGALVTNGGRILSVTAAGPTVREARETAYTAVAKVAFAGAQHRNDIAGGVE
ncbi:MAG: phosphoribosylamine--glycine ligase [Actinobacteria bacterium]|uniref:phosphoribosylamine--glycine ligase n=1 Tax=freshwater metagenome TaxID=449393 RepID=A0A6J6QJQ0_9ZZZZ|nr:phosphoribosylamine--glycine ligase [Actinomycetota bacterium]